MGGIISGWGESQITQSLPYAMFQMKRKEKPKFSLAEMSIHHIPAKIICTILLLHSSFDQENLMKLVKPFCVAVRDKSPAESARGPSGAEGLPERRFTLHGLL